MDVNGSVVGSLFAEKLSLFLHAVAKLSSNILDLPDDDSASAACGSSHTLIRS